MQEYIVLVNRKNEQIGIAPKLETHNANTPLHRAFSCYVFNEDGKFLLTRRALSKKVFPGMWTNSCCGHPGPGESTEDAVKRRLKYELGLEPEQLSLAIPYYRYKVEMNGIFEHEIAPVYIAKVSTEPKKNPKEVEDYQWVEWSDFLQMIEKEPEKYSLWCREQSQLLTKSKILSSKKSAIRHVAFIMDGNRRWAKEKRLPALLGHQRGYRQIEKIVNHAQDLEISYVTFWAFSTENWHRSDEEVSYLMELFRKALRGNLFRKLMKKGGRISVIGNIMAFPRDIQENIADIVARSKNNSGIQVTIALNYGGREDIVQAVQQMVSNKVTSNEITPDLLAKYLYTKNQPDPDLIIRTGGMQRLSGYLPWQSIYSELYFTDTHWPDFDEKAFGKAIQEYERRERTFGR